MNEPASLGASLTKTRTVNVKHVEWRFHTGQIDAWRSMEQYAAFRGPIDKNPYPRWTSVAAGRRWGKTVLAARWIMKGAYEDACAGLSGSKGLSWIVTPTEGQGRILWRKLVEEDPGWITGKRGSELKPIMILIGSATIEFHTAAAFSGNVGEGIRRLLIDESGEIPEHVFQQDLRPTLSDYVGPALFIGTPKGRRSWFWDMYRKGRDPSEKNHASFGGRSHENVYIPESDFIEMAADMPDRLYRQEILAEFLSMEGAVFRDIGRLRDPDWLSGAGETPGRLDPKLNIKTLVLGIDLGRRQNFTVIHGLGRGSVTFENGESTVWRSTWWDRFQSIDWPTQRARIKAQWLKLGKPLVVIDATHGSVGDPIADNLEENGVPVYRFEFTGPSRRGLLDRMIVGTENAELTLPDEPLCINEFDAFEMKETKLGTVRYEVPESGHDDCVFAAALALHGSDYVGRGSVAGIASGFADMIEDLEKPNPYRIE